MAIAATEKTLRCHQNRMLKHQHYFSNLIRENPLVLVAILIPAFIIGWKSGQQRHTVTTIKQFGQLAFLTIAASAREKMLQAIAKTLA